INLLGNTLVLVEPAAGAISLTIAPGFPLARSLGDGRLAIADPDAVPAGKYGKAALEALGVWPTVEGRLMRADDVRAALRLVARGEAPLGIVYGTDAAAEPKVKVVDRFPEDMYPSIVYPAALIAASGNPDAAEYLEFLASAARPLFEVNGFSVLAK